MPFSASTPPSAAAVTAVDCAAVERDLRTLIRIPSITGSEEAVQQAVERRFTQIGLVTARIDAEPAAIAADPGFPGSEMPRTALPIVTGRLGRPGGRRLLLVGHVDVVPLVIRGPGRPIHGVPRSAMAGCMGAAPVT